MSSCAKCQAPLKPNAKCCTQCGFRVAAAAAAPVAAAVAAPAAVSLAQPPPTSPSVCSGCQAPLKALAKCCTRWDGESAFVRLFAYAHPSSCGKRVVTASQPSLSSSAPLPVAVAEAKVAPAEQKKAERAVSPSAHDVCTQCGMPLKPNAKFCTNCGKRPERGESAPALFKMPEKPAERKEPPPQEPVAAAAGVAPRPAPAGVASLQVEGSGTVLRRKSVRKKIPSVGPKAGRAMASKNMIKCESCAHELNPSAVFCTKCGCQQKGSEKRIAMDGQECVACAAALKPGMSFCTKCGVQVGTAATGDDEHNKSANERRKKAALEAEAELEKHKAELEAREKEQITRVEARRKQSLKSVPPPAAAAAGSGAACRKCS